jgi:hypothetical protein
MNIKVDRCLFMNELHYLQGAAGTKPIIPVLSHLLIETGVGRITMRATDLDLMITTECEAVVREHGSICLPARKLMEIVKSLPQAEIEIKANDVYQATINCAQSRFKLLECRDRNTGESAYAICAINILRRAVREPEIEMVPLGLMFSSDPYEALIPASVSEFDALVKKEKMRAAGSKRRRRRGSRPQD